MYDSPSVVVSVTAVAPEIAPPAMVPMPGMSFTRPPTMARPAIVAPTVPVTDESGVAKNASSASSPNVVLMPGGFVEMSLKGLELFRQQLDRGAYLAVPRRVSSAP